MQKNQLLTEACQIAKSIFERNKTSGSSANMSFMYQGHVYITVSGTCFGNLDEDSFAEADVAGNVLNGKKPSKELPLHLILYQNGAPDVRAVIHTHSFYTTLWSCLDHKGKEDDVIPAYTPYLRMKAGKIRLIPYGAPGSSQLFDEFRKRVSVERGYLLAHHGSVVGASNLKEAFFALEELEESARIAWELRKEVGVKTVY